jgi:predicted O-linked N-acetylglucosamine transferase (SPINDLY family)
LDECPAILQLTAAVSHPPAIHPLLPEAASLHQSGRLAEAAALYEQIIAQRPGDFEATHLLGVVALQEGRYERAETLITAALAVDPQHSAALSNLGTVYLRTGRLDEARTQFERAASREPVPAGAWLNLGSILRQLKCPREAVVPLRRAYALDPNSAAAATLLGACLLDIGEAGAAAAVFTEATSLDPESADGWANLSIALRACAEPSRAAEAAARAVELQPSSSAALAALAAVQLQQGRVEEAILTYGEAVESPDPSSATHCAFALALFRNQEVDAAVEQLQIALRADGDNLLARWLLAMAQFRPIPDSVAEIEGARAGFARQLGELEEWFAAAPRADAFVVVGSQQPFYLAYHACNNRHLLMRYGSLCSRLMQTLPDAAPTAQELPLPAGAHGLRGARKLRIGILAAHVRSHAVWVAVTKGLVKNLDRDRFDVQLFQLDPESDTETEWARQQVDGFHAHPRDLAAWVAAIRAAKLDVAIFPEIGIDPLALQLAALRVAPVQATTWGHPQTSGLPTMDLYFSAEAFEPSGSEDHYSERLVRLPKLGACFEPWTIKTASAELASLGISRDERLVLCPGMPFKYSPLHDRLWARIARGLRLSGGGRLVFFLGNPEDMYQRLVLRLRRAFREERVNFDKEVYILPFIARSRFFGMMRESALMLDTLGFSGFNTALHGIEAGLPVLAREGDTMRGRLASGIMRQLDLPELIASSDEEFVEKAIQLTGDVKQRERLAREIEQRRGLLFNDTGAIRALEKILLEACDRS